MSYRLIIAFSKNIKKTSIIGVILCLTFFTNVLLAQLPAFPSAEGYGKNATGGRGGDVYFVTNLNDSGAGSLRTALQASGARTVIFRVGGTIDLKSSIQITNSNVTIAGETAPGGGITLRNNFAFSGALLFLNKSVNDVIIRNIRLRSGPGINDGNPNFEPEVDNHSGSGLMIGSGANIIIDSCSVSWATNENIQIWNNQPGRDLENVTIQNCIVSEGIGGSPRDPNAHSWGQSHGLLTGNTWVKGSALQTKISRISIIDNLFALNTWRNPYLKSDGPQTSYFQMANNVIYGWQSYGGAILGSPENNVASTIKISALNNYFKTSPETILDKKEFKVYDGAQIWAKGNIGPSRPTNDLDEWVIFSDLKSNSKSSSPINVPNTTLVSANDAYNNVLQNVGTTVPLRDSVDDRVIEYVQSGTGNNIRLGNNSRVNWPSLARGTAYTDADNDGMADDWEVQNFGSINTYNHKNYAPSGYTYLEEFLHCKAKDNANCTSSSNNNTFSDDIKPFTPPTNLSSGQTYTLNIPYSAAANRDINVSLQDRDNGWVTKGFGKASVNAGTGTVSVSVTVEDDALAGNNYSWTIYATPTNNGSFSANKATRIFENISVDFTSLPETDAIKAFSPPETVFVGQTYSVNIPYDAITTRDIHLTLQNLDDNWITVGSGKVTVDAGSGTASIDVLVKEKTALAGNNYRWTAYSTPIDNDAWTARRADRFIDNNTVVTDEIRSLNAVPIELTPGQTYSVQVPYGAIDNRDIHVSLQNLDDDWVTVGYGKTLVNAGNGTANVEVTLNSNALPGNNYRFTAYSTPTNGGWTTRTAENFVDNIIVIASSQNISQDDLTLGIYHILA